MPDASDHQATLERLRKGEHAVVGNAFMDWVEDSNPPIKNIHTIRNPDRVGTLDLYVAWIEPSAPRLG